MTLKASDAHCIEEAQRAFEAGDDARALVGLVELWRVGRAPAVAELVAHVDNRLRRVRPALDKKSWLARAAAGDPADLGLLADSVATPRGAESCARLEALASVDDPRLAAALTALLAAPPFSSSAGARPFYRALFAAAARLADPRLLTVADALRAAFARRFRTSGHGNDDLRRKLERLLAEIAARYPDGAPALDGADARRAAAFEAALGAQEAPRRRSARSGAELLAAIEANLDEDAPRAVYADWLAEAGDPRGELIVLQLAAVGRALTRDERRRERELLDAHFATWLGPLARFIAKQGSLFERGFLTEATLKPRAGLSDVAADPRWATVEALHVGESFVSAVPLLARARLPSLRALSPGGGVVAAHLPAIVANAHNLPRLAELGVEAAIVTDEHRQALAALAALPSLSTLRVHVWDAAAAATALAGALAPAPTVEIIELRGAGRARLLRGPDGRLTPPQ